MDDGAHESEIQAENRDEDTTNVNTLNRELSQHGNGEDQRSAKDRPDENESYDSWNSEDLLEDYADDDAGNNEGGVEQPKATKGQHYTHDETALPNHKTPTKRRLSMGSMSSTPRPRSFAGCKSSPQRRRNRKVAFQLPDSPKRRQSWASPEAACFPTFAPALGWQDRPQFVAGDHSDGSRSPTKRLGKLFGRVKMKLQFPSSRKDRGKGGDSRSPSPKKGHTVLESGSERINLVFFSRDKVAGEAEEQDEQVDVGIGPFYEEPQSLSDQRVGEDENIVSVTLGDSAAQRPMLGGSFLGDGEWEDYEIDPPVSPASMEIPPRLSSLRLSHRPLETASPVIEKDNETENLPAIETEDQTVEQTPDTTVKSPGLLRFEEEYHEYEFIPSSLLKIYPTSLQVSDNSDATSDQVPAGERELPESSRVQEVPREQDSTTPPQRPYIPTASEPASTPELEGAARDATSNAPSITSTNRYPYDPPYHHAHLIVDRNALNELRTIIVGSARYAVESGGPEGHFIRRRATFVFNRLKDILVNNGYWDGQTFDLPARANIREPLLLHTGRNSWYTARGHQAEAPEIVFAAGARSAAGSSAEALVQMLDAEPVIDGEFDISALINEARQNPSFAPGTFNYNIQPGYPHRADGSPNSQFGYEEQSSQALSASRDERVVDSDNSLVSTTPPGGPPVRLFRRISLPRSVRLGNSLLPARVPGRHVIPPEIQYYVGPPQAGSSRVSESPGNDIHTPFPRAPTLGLHSPSQGVQRRVASRPLAAGRTLEPPTIVIHSPRPIRSIFPRLDAAQSELRANSVSPEPEPIQLPAPFQRGPLGSIHTQNTADVIREFSESWQSKSSSDNKESENWVVPSPNTSSCSSSERARIARYPVTRGSEPPPKPLPFDLFRLYDDRSSIPPVLANTVAPSFPYPSEYVRYLTSRNGANLAGFNILTCAAWRDNLMKQDCFGNVQLDGERYSEEFERVRSLWIVGESLEMDPDDRPPSRLKEGEVPDIQWGFMNNYLEHKLLRMALASKMGGNSEVSCVLRYEPHSLEEAFQNLQPEDGEYKADWETDSMDSIFLGHETENCELRTMVYMRERSGKHIPFSNIPPRRTHQASRLGRDEKERPCRVEFDPDLDDEKYVSSEQFDLRRWVTGRGPTREDGVVPRAFYGMWRAMEDWVNGGWEGYTSHSMAREGYTVEMWTEYTKSHVAQEIRRRRVERRRWSL